MAPNDTTTGSSRFDVLDRTTQNNDTLTSDAAGNLLKQSGESVDPSEVISKKPSTDTSSSNFLSSSDSSSGSSSSSNQHFEGSGGDSSGNDDGGFLDKIIDFFSN